MAFDIEMIEKVYANLDAKVNAARKIVNKPLSLTEKYYTPIYGKVLQKLMVEVSLM